MNKNNDGEERNNRRKQQVDEIHAALGRYVESFEAIVCAVRRGSVDLACITTAQPLKGTQQQLMNVVFNHRSMSADSLSSIYYALVGQIINDDDLWAHKDEKAIVRKIIQQFIKDFKEATETRNDYLHGTWRIGWGNVDTTDWSEISFTRIKATKDGLSFVDGPKSAQDIEAQTEIHKTLTEYFMCFHICFVSYFMRGHTTPVSRNFTSVGQGSRERWEAHPPSR